MSPGAGPQEVLVTGVGLHGAHGDGPETWKAIREGRRAATRYHSPEAEGFPSVAAAPAPPCALDDLVPDRKLQKYMSPAAVLAVLAAGRALRDGGLLGDAERCARLGLFAATGLIGFELGEVTHAMSAAGPPLDVLDGERIARGLSLCHPLMPFRMLLNMPLGLVSIAYGIRGENAIFYPGPLQGGMALRIAFDAVASGRCARALAGGSVHGLALMPLSAAWRAGRLARPPEGPDHAGEDAHGLAATDAGAFVLLESRAAASERDARPRAALLAVKAGMEDDAAGRERAWRDLGTREPALVLSSGSLDAPSRAEDLRLAQRAGAAAGAVVNLDALAGHAGAAAPAAAIALAALALSDAAAAAAPPLGAAMVSARDPEGGFVLASLAQAAAKGLA